MLLLIYGWFAGVFTVLFLLYVIFFNPFGNVVSRVQFVDQFQPIKLPKELRKFLKSSEDSASVSKWESCFSLSLLLHFLFQEHKDTRSLRRWLHKRLQLELNDLTTRSAAGRLIQDVRIHDLAVGCNFPVLSDIRVESFKMLEDGEGFEFLNFLVNFDYAGGFQTSIDAAMILGRFAKISIKVTRLAGKLRFSMTREPFTHWVLSFVDAPILEMKVASQWQGKQLKHAIPLITQQFRRILHRKHVWPNYKVRFRPFFSNPILTPSPPIEAFNHIEAVGGLEVTVLKCSRLNLTFASAEHTHLYCSVSVDHQPLMYYSSSSSILCSTVLLNFIRHGDDDLIGLTFDKSFSELGIRIVQISSVIENSAAERCGFKTDDIVLAVNNVPVRNERQLLKLLSGTIKDLNVLVQRTIKVESLHMKQEGDLVIIEDVDDVDQVQFELDDDSIHNKSDATLDSSSVQIPVYSVRAPRKRSRSVSYVEDLLDKNLSDKSMSKNDKNDRLIATEEPDSFLRPTVTKLFSSVPVDCIVNKTQLVRKVKSYSDLSAFSSSTTFSQPHIDRGSGREDSEIKVNAGIDFLSSDQIAVSTDIHSLIGTVPDTDKKLRVPSRRERLQAKAAEVAAAGKAKMTDLWYRRRENSNQLELGVEASADLPSISPLSSPRLRKNVDIPGLQSIDSQTKKRRKRSPIGEDIQQNNYFASPGELDYLMNSSRQTRRLRLTKNVLFGQSLHFDLNKSKSRYLNVSVYSCLPPSSNTEDTANFKEPSDSCLGKIDMLGYTSVYIPQILSDCQLTLSSCHQELLTLRPPPSPNFKRAMDVNIQELSKHAGFDERICYGDILLGFRYFQQGLPAEVELISERTTQEVGSGMQNVQDDAHPEIDNISLTSLLSQTNSHQFANSILKKASCCAVCSGKIWFKNAAQCTKCYLVCHLKCINKIPKSLVCMPCERPEDDTFEILDSNILQSSESYTSSTGEEIIDNRRIIDEMMSYPVKSSETTSCNFELQQPRRRKLATRVTEKWSSAWSKVSRRKVIDETVTQLSGSKQSSGKSLVRVVEIIPEVFTSVDIPLHLKEMMFQPGNAYDEDMMNRAKNIGKDIFIGYDPDARRKKIDEHMDYIQKLIDKTTEERLKVINNISLDEHDLQFNHQENRLHALAVLMLHYCAALQDCTDREEEMDDEKLKREEKIDSQQGKELEVREEERHKTCMTTD